MKSGKHVRQSGKQFWKGGNEAGKSEKQAGSSGNLLWESGNPPGNSEEQLSKSGRRVEKTGNRVEENEKQVGKSGNGVEKSGDPLFDSGKELFKSAKRLFGNANPLLINQNELSKGEIDVEQRKAIDGRKTTGQRLPTQARREAQARQRAASRQCAAIEETSKTINPRRPKMKKKITTELLQFKKLDQICDFGVANGHRFAPGTPGADALAALRSTVSNLKVLTAAQASLENRLRELLRTKLEARLALREDVELLYHTAHAVAADRPGFDDKFQMSLGGDPKLLNAARSAIQDAAPTAGTFVQHAMPPDFLDALSGKVQELERAREEYANGKTACSAGQKALEESLRKALAAASGFDAIMRNTFRDDPITLEAWKTACRVPRTPRKKKEDPPGTGQPQAQAQPQGQAQPQPA